MLSDCLLILGLVLLTAAGFLVAMPLGFLVAGAGCVFLALTFAGDPR
jgi:hypothetical protein